MNRFRYSCVFGATSCTTMYNVFKWRLCAEHRVEKGSMSRVERIEASWNSRTVLSFLQGHILEKMNICSMPQFFCFLQDSLSSKENHGVFVKDLRFGTIPVRLFRPKAASSKPRRGILFFHGGGAMIGSLGKKHPYSTEGEGPHNLHHSTHFPWWYLEMESKQATIGAPFIYLWIPRVQRTRLSPCPHWPASQSRRLDLTEHK